MPLLQRDLHAQLAAGARASQERIAALVRPVDGGRLAQRPPGGGWSMAEVLEHLCVADELYDAPIRAAVNRGRVDAGAPLREWRPTFLGGLMARGLAGPLPLKTPKAMRPGPSPRAGVVEAFLARHAAFIRAMDDTAALDWRTLKVRLPTIPLLRLNLGDVYRINVVHVQRHAAQLERILRA